MRNEAVSTHLCRDKMRVVKNLFKQLLGSDEKRAETSGMTNRHDVCDLLLKCRSEEGLRKSLGGNYSTIQTIKHLTGFS